MPEIVITQNDLRDAENFLVEYMSEKVKTASFEIGSATRDIMVSAFTYVYAYLRGEIDRATARQSLLRIQEELTDADDISQAIDELLSNWFVSRKAGKYARMTARLHFLSRRTQSIKLSTRFWRTNTLIFYIDAEEDPYVIPEDQLFPVFDTSGNLVDYVVDVPLIAARVGEGFNIDPGTFIKVDISGGLPYFSYAENTEKSSGGKGTESTSELVERSGTAISVRNLINNRSCDVTLQEEFPELEKTLTIGMGESEMIRDRRIEIANHIKLHIGGHYDTYLQLDLTTVEENLTVGGFFPRPDRVISVFRDPELTYDLGQTFPSLGIQPGHILYIRSGIIQSPRGYPIVRVDDHELGISDNVPFSQASDEMDPNAVLYSVGWLAPAFEEIDFGGGVYQRTAAPSLLPASENVPAGTSRHMQSPGCVILSGKPVQDILTVEVTDPTGGDPLIDPSTSTILFNNRVNRLPAEQAEPAYTEYQMSVLNPEKAQSMDAVNKIIVGYGARIPPLPPDMTIFDGKNLRVVYRTLQGFSNIHDYVTNRNYRVTSSNHLVRARHPVWIELNIPYRLKPTATEALDEDAASQMLTEHINAFDPNDDLDVSDIATKLRQEYSQVGAVYPMEIYYHLDSPDGQQVFYSTTDIVSIFMSSTNGVVLENSDDITPPQDLLDRGIVKIESAQDLRDWYDYVGVSDRTVEYRTAKRYITFVQRG